ncbi:D-amino-acid transaminase [Bacillus massiliglaciei]|uniref:D-amino-acid transaminase n=1 Tax=Bacillus massiliglaciei TaxID=1816693 RepID=UPI000A40C8A2|nr:D-amino-acid transaminase [Bacillus massiliglaciei]
MEKMILNGEMKDRSEIRIDIEDRGYQFGDGVYEVIRIYNGLLFAGDMHIKRLFQSAELISISIPYTQEELMEQLKRLVKTNDLQSGIIYLQYTRGVSPRSHAFPFHQVEPVYVAYTKEMPAAKGEKAAVRAVTAEDIRWLRCNIKSLNLLGNILAKEEAVKAGCEEAIQHRGDIVTEGSSSNVFIAANGAIKTHPANNLILNGITRQVVLQLCGKLEIPVQEEAFTMEELLKADEVFYTSTGVEVTGISEVDGKIIGNGQTGPLTQKLQQAFCQEIERQCGRI